MTWTVIRVDQDVRTELRRRAVPLQETANSVLRRLLDLPEEDKQASKLNPRVAKLLAFIQDLVGQTVQLQPHLKGHAILGRTEKFVAYIQPQKEWVKVVARKVDAEKAGLDDWESQRQDRYFGCAGVRWYIPDADEQAYHRVAAVLEKLWNTDFYPFSLILVRQTSASRQDDSGKTRKEIYDPDRTA